MNACGQQVRSGCPARAGQPHGRATGLLGPVEARRARSRSLPNEHRRGAPRDPAAGSRRRAVRGGSRGTAAQAGIGGRCCLLAPPYPDRVQEIAILP
jgi:hypothetical protein